MDSALSIPGMGTRAVRYEMGTLVELRAKWSDPWKPAANVWADAAEVHALSVGHSRAALHYRYGRLFEPGAESAFAVVSPVDWSRYWVRVSLVPPTRAAVVPQPVLQSGSAVQMMPPGYDRAGTAAAASTGAPKTPVFVGMIQKELDEFSNSTSVLQRMPGDELLAAVGPERLLDECHIAESVWDTGSALVRLGWCPSFNELDDSGRLRGNRSTIKSADGSRPGGDTCYHFGGDAVWSLKDIAEYIAVEFLSVPNGPRWALSGAVDFLDSVRVPVEMEPVQTARQILDRVIPTRWGVDGVVWPLDADTRRGLGDGFQIYVFSLLDAALSAGGYTVPANAAPWDLTLTGAPDIHARVEWCTAQLYDRVEVLGSRMQIVISGGYGAGVGASRGWTADDEMAYLDALGFNGYQNDEYRAQDKFRDVFQTLLLARTWQTGAAYPRVKLDGTLETSNVPAQAVQRRTLPRLPLFAGWDYSVNPPVYRGGADVVPDPLPAAAWVYDEWLERFLPVDQLGTANKRAAHVSPLRNEWGIRLRSNPNHVFALHHWSGANGTYFLPGDKYTAVDWQKTVFTIAVESDHRVRVGATFAGGYGLGLVQYLHVPDAELNLVAPNTILGTKADGTLLKSAGAPLVVRDDRDMLLRTLAGAQARFLRLRVRLTLDFQALIAGNSCIGGLCRNLDSGIGARSIRAPVTSCAWDFNARRTVLYCGQAER